MGGSRNRRNKKKRAKASTQVEEIDVSSIPLPPSPPPPPPPEESAENEPNSSQRQYYSSSLENSPFKVLLESSKTNVMTPDQSAAEKAKLTLKMSSRELRKTTDKIREQAVECFNETLKKNLTPSGALDMDGFINNKLDDTTDGGGANKMVVILPQDHNPNEVGVTKNGGGVVGGAPLFVLPDGGTGEGGVLDNGGISSSDAAKKAISRKVSDSSGTDTAEFDDNSILQEMNPELDYEYLKVEVEEEPPFEPLQESDLPFKMNTMRQLYLLNITSLGENPQGQLEETPSQQITNQPEQEKSKKRYRPTTILKPLDEGKLASSSSSGNRQPKNPFESGESRRAVQEIVDRSFKSQLNTKRPLHCQFGKCMKEATVKCQICDRILYCTDRHRKLGRKEHELYCKAYREMEHKAFGKHLVAARDIPRASEIIERQEPLVVLPLNPILEKRKFPSNYCVKCFVTKDENTGDFTSTKVEECQSCSLVHVCQWMCQTMHHKRISGDFKSIPVPDHDEFECRLFTASTLRGAWKNKYLLPDQSVLGLIRCIPKVTSGSIRMDYKGLMDLVNSVELGPYTKNFGSKMMMLRECLEYDKNEKEISNYQLFQLDQALLRFGRNIGPYVVNPYYKECYVIPTYTRCVYPKLAHVIHSCVPNTVLVVSEDLSATLVGVVDNGIKKGDVLSVCYDERLLFIPTRMRRRYLLRDFGFTCKCKRCLSPSELDTYFASFPCSNPKCSKGYLVPVTPLNHFSYWLCNKCKKTPVSFLRIIDVTYSLGDELKKPIMKKDPIALVELMEELVSGNYLHWNHHLIFNASIDLFGILWEELSKNNMKIMDAYSKCKGLQFLKPAESVINITWKFMPDGYINTYILPLRLAAMIKLRHLTDQLSRKETTLGKVDYAINEMYFRAYDVSKCPLYERPITKKGLSSGTERNLKVLEMKVVKALLAVAEAEHGPCYYRNARGLQKMFNAMKENQLGLLGLVEQKKLGIFPWDMEV